MADPSMGDLRPLMAAEMKARADQLAAILDIPADFYTGHEAETYQIMANLAAIPTKAVHNQRRRYKVLGGARTGAVNVALAGEAEGNGLRTSCVASPPAVALRRRS